MLLHPCHRRSSTEEDSRSRHSSSSCNGCSDCEAADTLLSMRQFCGVQPSNDARKAASIPPRLRSKQYRDNYFGENASSFNGGKKNNVSVFKKN